MQKREKVLGVAAVGTGLFFVINQFVCSADPPVEEKNQQKSKKAVVSEAGQKENKNGSASGKIKTSPPGKTVPRILRTGVPAITFTEWGRDPFAGALSLALAAEGATADSASALALHGIAWKNGQGMVLIGDKILRQGERVDDLDVLEIFPDRALVRQNGKLLVLLLRDESIENGQP
jgi:hypothetical protein